jgi:type I restriction enzyme S subunit
MREEPLGDLLESVIDHRGKTPKKLGGDFVKHGVPVVSAIHIKDGRIQWDQRERFVTPQMFAKWMPVRLCRGDVLLTSEAPLGETALVPSNDDLVLSQRLFALRGKAGVLDSTYLRYFLASATGQERLKARATGTTVTGIRQAELLKVLVPLPSIAEQRRIAAVLGALDELIETNRRLALGSEDLAVSLARKSPSQVPLRQIAFIGGGKVGAARGVVDHYSLPSFDVDRLPQRVDGSTIKSNKTELLNPVVLVARLNPHIPRIWMVYPDQGVVSAASTEFVPLMSDSASVEEVWSVCADSLFIEQMNGLVTGTTGSHQRVEKDSLMRLVVPDVRRLDPAHRAAIAPLVREAHASRRTARQLMRTRDELMPLLLSGRVSVREVTA